MRISWLSAEEIAAARQALTANGRSWEDYFAVPDFVAPPIPEGLGMLDWERITEHVARAERVSQVVRDEGVDAARERFGASQAAIERATLSAALHEDAKLTLDDVIAVLHLPIDQYVFYAPFLELLMELGRPQQDRAIEAYEAFVEAYAAALVDVRDGHARIGAVRDGLADAYVTAGKLDEAHALFERRHEEDQRDVAVALSASRAFLAAGSIAHAVRWLGVGAARATMLGRDDMATRLRAKQEAVRKRLS